VARDAAVGYLDVLRAKSFERISRENLALTRSNLEVARSRRRIGVARAAEVVRWENQVAVNQRSVIEAAAIDRASPARRFWTIVFPLLSPTTFFLLVVNLVYAFFDTFSLIHATTSGGPANATSILVYRVYNTGFVGLDYGSSGAQSVILMILVIGMTVIQFRYVERKVQY